ncbi:thioredoxin domain-containing protein [Dactylosporangium sp. NPDC005572]|uniref:DsbA family protein n=1 Tax=Dactylosporangium sp. NPDC005572 TaxID=3156889 RepID=UPI0033B13905
MSKQARQARSARLAAQQRRQRRNRLLAAGGGVVILGLLVAIVAGLVHAAGTGDSPEVTQRPTVAPANANASGAIVIGDAAAPVRLEIYLDYMCPYCGRFERANSGELERLVADGTVRLELYPLAFLDRASAGTRYSTRAANAVAVVADRAPAKVLAFNSALFTRQPREGSEGLTDNEIAAVAVGAGVAQDVAGLFTAGTFEPWIVTRTDAAFGTGGITGTPTVKIDGAMFKGDLYTAGPLTQAVMDAKSRP